MYTMTVTGYWYQTSTQVLCATEEVSLYKAVLASDASGSVRPTAYCNTVPNQCCDT